MNTRNFGDVIRAKLEADPELKKLVDVECRILEAVMEAYDDFKDVIHDAKIEGAKAMQEAYRDRLQFVIRGVNDDYEYYFRDGHFMTEIFSGYLYTTEEQARQEMARLIQSDRVNGRPKREYEIVGVLELDRVAALDPEQVVGGKP